MVQGQWKYKLDGWGLNGCFGTCAAVFHHPRSGLSVHWRVMKGGVMKLLAWVVCEG